MRPLPILYSFRRCPYAMRVRLALVSSEIEVEIREVVLRDKPEQMLEMSPKATVPVLITTDAQVIDESLDIMLWALARNDPQNWLPSDVALREDMLELINRCDTQFKPHLDRYKYANRYEDVIGADERAKAGEFIWQLDGHLAKHEYLFTNEISIADMAIVTFVRQFANVDREWFDKQDWAHLIGWLEVFLASNRFAAIMDKNEKWEEGADVITFPAEGFG